MTIKIYVRMPCRIEDEHQIKILHPDIETVRLPRQKSAKFCHIIFEDQETCDRVSAVLKDLRIKGKKLKVMPALPKDVANPTTRKKKNYTKDSQGTTVDASPNATTSTTEVKTDQRKSQKFRYFSLDS